MNNNITERNRSVNESQELSLTEEELKLIVFNIQNSLIKEELSVNMSDSLLSIYGLERI